MARPRPDDKAVVFLFRFGHDGSSMVVTMADAERVLDTASKTRLCRREPQLLLDVFMENCGAGPDSSPRSVWMNKPDFDASIRELVPARWIMEEDKQRLSQVLSAIFYAFEEHPGQGVCVAEIVGGLSLLCGGNKSSKLAFAFHLFAEHDNESGYLTPKLLGNFLGSFATVLCACTEEGMEMAPERLRGVIDAASTTAVGSVLDTLAETTSVQISFEDVGNWYNTGGFEIIPWLELLDLRKWAATTGLEGPSAPPVDDAPTEKQVADANPASRDMEAGVQEHESENAEDHVAFQFSMGAPNSSVLLTITEEDVSNVLELAQGTGLANKDPAVVAAALLAASENPKTKKNAADRIKSKLGLLTKEAFDHCIRSLVPGRRLSQGQKERFSGLLTSVFYAFDFDRSSSVDARDLASGFFLLCSGNKSVKLASAFRLLDEDGDDQLSRDAVWRFLRSLLSILMGFSTACQSKEQSEVAEEVNSVAAWTSNLIFQSPNLSNQSSLSFDELAAWYTSEGYKVAPWLELLDLNKWAVGAAAHSGPNGFNGSPARPAEKYRPMLPPGKPLIAEPKFPPASSKPSAGGTSSSRGGGKANPISAPVAAGKSRAGNGVAVGEDGSRGVGGGVAARPAAAGVSGGPGGGNAGGDNGTADGGVRRSSEGNGVDDPARGVAGSGGYGGSAVESASAAGGNDVGGGGAGAVGQEGGGIGGTASSQVLFTFPLVPDVELLVMQEDVDFVQRIVVGTRLAALLPQDILETFRDKATPGPRGKEVTKTAFDEGMQELVRLQSMLDDERDLLSFALANIFFAYDREQGERVLLRDLACGLSFLCCGSKSSKLAFAYSLFTGEGVGVGGGESAARRHHRQEPGALAEGEVSRQAIGAFVSGLLTVLCSCVGQMLELTNREMWAIVDRSAEFTLEALFEDEDSVYEGRIGLTFEEFGLWYNEGGFKSVPWMELVDLSKWVPGVGALRPVMEGPLGNGAVDMEKKPRFCFQISESANPVHLVISDDDATAVLDLVNKTGLRRREPADVCGKLMSMAKDGVLSKAAFDKCIRDMVPASQLGNEEKTSFSVLLSSIFFSFDRDNSSSADAIELASGFSLLCAGSKSAKLAFAFGLHDEDGDERLTRRGLWRYTRSFLTALMALSFASSSLSAEELTRAVDDGAVWTSAAIFAETATQTPNRIAFDEFAAWYTEGGFRVSPWLELLDMKKWDVPASSAHAPATGPAGSASE